jgi:hypothetical protein
MGAVCFCGPIRQVICTNYRIKNMQVTVQVAPSRGLPGTLPCGVRTFLDGT